MGTDGPHRDREEGAAGWLPGSRSATWFDRTRLGAFLGEYFIVTGRDLAKAFCLGMILGFFTWVLL